MAVDTAPPPPESHLCVLSVAWCTTALGAPVTGSLGSASAYRARLEAASAKLVSVMPSGPKTRSCSTAPSGLPVTASTTKPNTSVEKPYSQFVPGSNNSGDLASAAIVSSFDMRCAAQREDPG